MGEVVKLPSMPIGFDIGGVVTDGAARYDVRHWLDDEVGYLLTPTNPGFRREFKRLVDARYDPQDIYFVSKCNATTAAHSQEYLAAYGVHDLGIPKENLLFTPTREGKAPIIRELGLRAFADDRAEILVSLHGIVEHRLLFKPNPEEAAQFGGDDPGITTFFRWQRMVDHLIALPA